MRGTRGGTVHSRFRSAVQFPLLPAKVNRSGVKVLLMKRDPENTSTNEVPIMKVAKQVVAEVETNLKFSI
jgi:hypothetical protein